MLKRVVRTPWYLVLVFGAITVALLVSGKPARCVKDAWGAFGTNPTDYCYVASITAKYTGGGTLTNTAFRVPNAQGFNASGLISANHMDNEGWDVHPATSSFVETDGLLQNMSSSTAPWWFQVPSITSGNTVTVDVYYGESDIARDQGLLLTGSDSASSTHVAAFNISDNLTLRARVELLSSSAQTATVAEHWDNNAGYGLYLIDSSGLTVRGRIDATTCDLAWPGSATNQNVWIDLVALSGTTTITIATTTTGNIASQTCAGDSSIAATSTPLEMGASAINMILRDVKLLSGTSTIAHYGFNPKAMLETRALNPLYTGSLTDESGNGRDAVYYLIRDQTNWTVTVGSERLVSSGDLPAEPSTDVNLLGSDQFGIGLGLTPTPEVTSDMFHILFAATVNKYDDEGGPRSLAWAAFFGTASIGFALVTFVLIRYMPLAIMAGGVPLVYGVVKGYLPAWLLFVWAVFAISAWFAVRRGETSS